MFVVLLYLVLLLMRLSEAGLVLCSLVNIVRAARTSHNPPLTHPKWLSDPPFTLISVLNRLIGDAALSPDVRTRACYVLCER